MNLEQKRSKKYAWIATIIYLLLFPILIGLAGASFMVFDSSSMTIIGGLSLIFMYFCIPVSIPITLYLVWSRYTQGKYRQSRVFCLIPLVILIMTAIYDSLISAIHYWL
jgi:hypothetical protein